MASPAAQVGKVTPREASHTPSRLSAMNPVAGDAEISEGAGAGFPTPTSPATSHHHHFSWEEILTSESSSTSGAGAGGLSREGLGGADEGEGETEVQDGTSPLSRAGKAARPTSSSGMSSRVLVSAARRASFSLSMI